MSKFKYSMLNLKRNICLENQNHPVFYLILTHSHFNRLKLNTQTQQWEQGKSKYLRDNKFCLHLARLSENNFNYPRWANT